MFRRGKPIGSRIWKVLNSAFFIAITGFVLTGIIGTCISNKFAASERDRETQQREFEEAKQDKLLEAQRNQVLGRDIQQAVQDPVLRRLGYTELVIELHKRVEGKKEAEAIWQGYLQAYSTYFLFRTENEVPPQKALSVGADVLDTYPIIWTYLQRVVDPEFAHIHDCVLISHAIYDPGDAGKTADTFNNCLQDPHNNGPHFFTARLDGKVDPWGLFQGCVGTLMLQLHYELVFREQLASEDPDGSEGETTPLAKCDKGYDGDAHCRQLRFNQDLLASLTDACGPLQPNWDAPFKPDPPPKKI